MLSLKSAKRSVEAQLEQEMAANKRLQDVASKVEQVAKGREKEMAGSMRELTEEHASSMSGLRAERAEKERLKMELETARHEMQIVADKLRAETEQRREAQRKCEKYRRARHKMAARGDADSHVETRLTSELERRLEAEQRSRQASEKWLHAELRTKEEMEGLFVALRDIAMKKPEGELKALKDEMQNMRKDKEREMRQRREEFDSSHGRLVEDNRRLQLELTDMREQISQRLFKAPDLGAEYSGRTMGGRAEPLGRSMFNASYY